MRNRFTVDSEVIHRKRTQSLRTWTPSISSHRVINKGERYYDPLFRFPRELERPWIIRRALGLSATVWDEAAFGKAPLRNSRRRKTLPPQPRTPMSHEAPNAEKTDGQQPGRLLWDAKGKGCSLHHRAK